MIVLTAVLIEHAAKFSVFTGQSSPQQGGSLCSSKRASRGMRRTSCRRPICTRVRLTVVGASLIPRPRTRTGRDSAGVLHLKKLLSAGMTHVHLLPTFQFAGVDDQKENWRFVDTSILESLPPDSDQQVQPSKIWMDITGGLMLR